MGTPAAPHASPARQYLAMWRRADLLERYRKQIFYLLAGISIVFLLPTANHFVQGRNPQGLATLALNLTLLINAWCYYRQRPLLVPAWLILVPVLTALVLAIRVQGFSGVLWAYPAILLFHFLATRLVANIFNLLIVAIVVPVTWTTLGPELGGRMGVTLLLVILFTNVFSYIAERQQRKEAEQREELDAQARQLHGQNQALREAIRMREELERIARHDLKTPLASIASVPRLLREGRTLDARESELLGMVEGAALRVLSMLNLSLDLYRMEEGQYQLRAQAVDLGSVARTVARELEAHAGSKNVRLRLDVPEEPVWALGEELLCYSILANLMRNAVEAAPEGSKVHLRLTVAADGRLVLGLHNDGAVPAAVRERFFEKYATYGKAGGTGLGAYSARLMAKVQGGDLQMRTDDAEGTTLMLRLPAWHPNSVDARETAPGTVPMQLSASEALPALSVLLADDDEYNIMVLRNLLPSPPLEVRVAVNGRAALDAVAQARPDIIFLDLEMPVMGGLEALTHIRALQAERGEPPSRVVAFSAHDDAATRARCRDAGFDLYLTKPASREELMAVLRELPPPSSLPVSVAAELTAEAPAAEAQPDVHVVHVEAGMLPLMPEFLASRQTMTQELAAAVVQADAERARALAHKLAGSLGMYGLRHGAVLARRIERAAGGTPPALAEAAALARELKGWLARVEVRERPQEA